MAKKSLVERSRRLCTWALAVSLCVLLVPPVSVPQAHAADGLTEEQLAPFVVPGLDPDNTKVNLFDYTTGKTGTGNFAGTDAIGDTGFGDKGTPYYNFTTWLTGDNNINKGRLLAFGDGMRHMGYWNQGLVASYNDYLAGGAVNTDKGAFANSHPGMQGIVERSLSAEGFPVVSADETTGYNVNSDIYNVAARNTQWSKDEMIYGNAGPLFRANLANTRGDSNFDPVLAWNVGRVVQAQALAISEGRDFDFSPFNIGSGSFSSKSDFRDKTNYLGVNWAEGYDLPESVRSLQYLFDPDMDAPGKVASHENVTGLFQMDDQGYYYYNMRENFAQFQPDPVVGDDGKVISDGHFVLYDAPAGYRTDGPSVGGFFPFNSASKAFKIQDGKLANNLDSTNNKEEQEKHGIYNDEPVNHHLGMTIETSFRQPVNGEVGGKHMTFDFAGDDDVWVFVDDVLVLDMGGIHSEVYGSIDFSTGDVYVGPSYVTGGIPDNLAENAVIETTLRDQFVAAGKADTDRWKGNTFASNTSHTLKMFYLERGNYDSSIAIRFNLQPVLYQQICKVDQYGDPLAGAEFDLFAARPVDGTVPTIANSSTFNLEDVEIVDVGRPLTHLVTDESGVARFEDPTLQSRDTAAAEPFNFFDRYNPDTGDGLLYILRETKAPAGYKSTPQDLLLRFEPDYTMLAVNNRYQTGAYASFVSRVTGNTGSVFYGQIGEDGGLVTQIPGSDPVPVDVQRDGLVVVVPMIKEVAGGTTQWLPLYGDNLSGFHAVHYDESRDAVYEEFKRQARKVTLEGALMQMAQVHDSSATGGHASGWYLEWDEETGRLGGFLENLPGRADRYLLQNPATGDMRNFYAIIKPDALAAALGVSRAEVAAMSSADCYAALGAKASEALAADGGEPGDSFDRIIADINPDPEDYRVRGYCSLDIQQFTRDFRSRIYIPNEQRELRVMKVDQDGNPRNGAVFALYGSRGDAEANDVSQALASGKTASIEGADGMLIFEPHEGHSGHAGTLLDGYGDMVWPDTRLDGQAETYYLREVSAPEGCELNPAIMEVKAGVYSIYADAGEADDGVTVVAGVGKLAQTMVKYASEGDVNITLRGITSIAQHQESGSFAMDGWVDTPLPHTGTNEILRSMDLHYGLNAVVDYGLHNEDGGKNYQPFFVTDTGFIRTRVQQDLGEHTDPGDPYYSTAERDDLGDMDITGLFSLINTVVVTDRDTELPGSGTLVLSKLVQGEGLTDEDYLRNYSFELHLYGKDGKELTDSFYYYGRDRTGYVKSGDTLPLSHEEELRILGVPEGATYSVEEREANAEGWYTRPSSGKREGVVEADGVHYASFLNAKGVRPDAPAVSIEKAQAIGDSAEEGSFTTDALDVAAGDVVTYRLTVRNTGGSFAEDVRVSDAVPEGLVYVEGSASDEGVFSSGTVCWSLGSLEAGESRTVTFGAKVPDADGPASWTNVGSVLYVDDDGEESNPLPSNEVTIEMVGQPDPDEPGNPDEPGEPDEPSEPPFDHEKVDIVDPGDPKPLPTPEAVSEPTMAPTGDAMPVAAAVVSLVVAIGAGVFATFARRRPSAR